MPTAAAFERPNPAVREAPFSPPPFSPLRRRRRAGDPRHCGVPAVGAQAGGSRPTAAGARMTQARKSGDTEFPPGGRLKTAGAAVVWGLGR